MGPITREQLFASTSRDCFGDAGGDNIYGAGCFKLVQTTDKFARKHNIGALSRQCGSADKKGTQELRGSLSRFICLIICFV